MRLCKFPSLDLGNLAGRLIFDWAIDWAAFRSMSPFAKHHGCEKWCDMCPARDCYQRLMKYASCKALVSCIAPRSWGPAPSSTARSPSFGCEWSPMRRQAEAPPDRAALLGTGSQTDMTPTCSSALQVVKRRASFVHMFGKDCSSSLDRTRRTSILDAGLPYREGKRRNRAEAAFSLFPRLVALPRTDLIEPVYQRA